MRVCENCGQIIMHDGECEHCKELNQIIDAGAPPKQQGNSGGHEAGCGGAILALFTIIPMFFLSIISGNFGLALVGIGFVILYFIFRIRANVREEKSAESSAVHLVAIIIAICLFIVLLFIYQTNYG